MCEHLRITLYSYIAAVLTEVVANAWGADAENGITVINENDLQISIVDDGIGMTVYDRNKMYLRVEFGRCLGILANQSSRRCGMT